MKFIYTAIIVSCLVMSGSAQQLVINENEYFDSPALSVLAFHNIYPIGMQGGIEIIHHNKRVATNGNVVFKIKKETKLIPGVDFQHVPVPGIENPERIVDRVNNRLKMPFHYEKPGLKYHILITPGDHGAFIVDVNFDEPVNGDLFEEIAFTMDFYPEAYAGKTFTGEDAFGVFPFDFIGEVVQEGDKRQTRPMIRGTHLVLAPEELLLKMEIVSNAGELIMEDNRGEAQRMWFRLTARADLSKQQRAVSITFRPNIVSGWSKPPMIAVSQVGYHPGQPKRAIIELEKGATGREPVTLFKIQTDGRIEEVERKIPESWGDYLRYTYVIYDFSHIQEPGLYRIAYGSETAHIFSISETIYKQGVWQPALETFLPVQMCHMSVRDRGRLWHAACHLDDALQAPAPLAFFDGFRQSDETETGFAPKTTIPGLNVGGWHDAGDDDINTGSSGKTAYHLALAIEEFSLNSDQTTVDFGKREVHLHQPDGIPDAVQQVMHGVHWLLAQYRQLDHSIAGVISSSWETYLQTADWGVFTDNLFYDPGMKAGEKDGTYSDVFDDRYAFTNKDTSREYMVAAILAAGSRVLKIYDEALSAECLQVAEKIWNYEENHEPVSFRTVGTPRSLTGERTNAAVELYLTTNDRKYLNAILDKETDILKDIRNTGWTICRVIDHLDNPAFRMAYEERLKEYASGYAEDIAHNPFHIKTRDQVWGIGWNILWQAQSHYFLIKKYPQIFSRDLLFDVVNYTLGVHPGSNTSLVSSVGTHRPIPAFGINRSDYSYIPGGVYSGPAMVLPDFPELKDDHPYLWHQSEYMVFGATPYIFCVLAADALLSE